MLISCFFILLLLLSPHSSIFLSTLLFLFHRHQDMVPDLHLLFYLLLEKNEAWENKTLQGWLFQGSQAMEEDSLRVGRSKSVKGPLSIWLFQIGRNREESTHMW